MAMIDIIINNNVVHSRTVVDQVCEFVGKSLYDDYQVESLRKQGLKVDVVIHGIQSKMNSKGFDRAE
jgi:hypothetical protein